MTEQTILLIEDDKQFRNFVKEVLLAEGYTVLQAEDGSHGVEMIKEHDPDLIITDLLMPRKDGIRLITETRSSHPHIPIIAMSGGTSLFSPAFLEAANTLGASHTLDKPFTDDALLVLVNKYLG
ncbi:MAG: response regulator [Gammaproteobacteria bacterium]|nr:response regulator [Gammaproteobacteria bacterium]